MMAHLGYRGLKDVLTDTKLEKVISISKSEGKKIESDGDDDNKNDDDDDDEDDDDDDEPVIEVIEDVVVTGLEMLRGGIV